MIRKAGYVSKYFFYGAAYQKSQSAVFMLPEKGVPSAIVGVGLVYIAYFPPSVTNIPPTPGQISRDGTLTVASVVS